MTPNKYDLIVIGAGPAGVSLALPLSKAGFKVAILEANSKLALKPCGNGVVRVKDLPYSLPKSSLLIRIRRGLLYVDNELATEIEGYVEGYIINKREMLEEIIATSGADLYLRSKLNPNTLEAKVRDKRIKLREANVVLATGNAFYDGEKIFAVETVVRPSHIIDENTIEIRFDTKLIGYYWVFPSGDGRVQVGVGGYSNPNTLVRLLKKFLSKDERFRESGEPKVRGSYISVGGLRLEPFKGINRVGEAAGFVLPLTGEGIRPSILSAHRYATALLEREDPLKAIKGLQISEAIRVQRRILEKVKEMDVERRRELLKSIPPEVHAEVALGTLRRSVILKALAFKPRLLRSILRFLQ